MTVRFDHLGKLANAAVVALWSVSAFASDDTRTRIEQNIGQPVGTARAARVEQATPKGSRSVISAEVTKPDRSLISQPRPERTVDAAAQVASKAPSRATTSQLTNTAPSAAAPPSPSTVAQGRLTSTTRPDGPDRCDPANRSDAAVPSCEDVLETRADQFAAPDPDPLSPEQRLLASQYLVEKGGSIKSATRRLANGQLDGSPEALAVASTALSSNPEVPVRRPRDEKEPEASPADSVIAGIITLITGSAPPP